MHKLGRAAQKRGFACTVNNFYFAKKARLEAASFFRDLRASPLCAIVQALILLNRANSPTEAKVFANWVALRKNVIFLAPFIILSSRKSAVLLAP